MADDEYGHSAAPAYPADGRNAPAARGGQVEQNGISLTLFESFKKFVFNVLWVVFVEAAGLDGAGDRQILARHDHRRCCHRSLSIRGVSAVRNCPPSIIAVPSRSKFSVS